MVTQEALMSKKVKTIIIGAVVLVVLVGVLVVLQLTKEKPIDVDKLASEAQEEFVTLINGPDSNLEYIHIKNEKDDYIIDRQAEERWGIKDIMDYEQTYYLYTETVAMGCNVVASSVIEENSSDLSKYGLINPSLVFEVKFKDSPAKSVSVGSLSTDGKIRYGCETGKNTVYAFPSTAFGNLFYSRYDYIDKVVVPGLESDQVKDIPIVNEMSVSRPDLEKPIVLTQFKEGELSENASTQATLYLSSPVRALISETPAQEYVYGNFGIVAETIVTAKPTEAQLKEFGFDKPTSEFMIRYNDTTKVKVTTGKAITSKSEIVSYYALREGTDQVYIVKATDMKWMNFQVKDILSSIVVLPHILDLDSIDATLEGKTNAIKYIRGADPKDVNAFKATLNGKDVDVSNAKAFMQLCQLTSVQNINKIEPTVEPIAQIKYNYLNGKSDLVEVYVLPDLTCIVSLNGNKAFTGRPGYVDKLIKEMKNLTNGKTVDLDW